MSAELIAVLALLLVNLIQLQAGKRTRCEGHAEIVQAINEQWKIVRRIERVVISQGVDPKDLSD